ncbi:hypothetical protein SERLA73DRAFT_68780 [Serpula lacrymans var. lacrymans S7.3]|uniref:Uncharacterized protein n=2 Tax=Serpula lacrymans var. lacrymans TaxID=341189 RepID=F8PIA1_SERL3|nr:uncharacterized protein SERLADRAFT_432552 [Serpula lacrymans var. lacrymans S7.9]EGO05144.1 hypothetical protein SERLA73DRAFT_68780 [Serpula lacrymans var. lacrymans S7.3]EGO30891.1 hypothetical protein SERLADRAFT_432552 [Serpula lacrymans var. lacrymans S7.9]
MVMQYIRDGLCGKDKNGKIILPDGKWIPRTLPGKIMKEQIDNWHILNPGQKHNANPHIATHLFEIKDAAVIQFELHPEVLESISKVEEIKDDEEDGNKLKQLHAIEAHAAEICKHMEKKKKTVCFDGAEFPKQLDITKPQASTPVSAALNPTTTSPSDTTAKSSSTPPSGKTLLLYSAI